MLSCSLPTTIMIVVRVVVSFLFFIVELLARGSMFRSIGWLIGFLTGEIWARINIYFYLEIYLATYSYFYSSNQNKCFSSYAGSPSRSQPSLEPTSPSSMESLPTFFQSKLSPLLRTRVLRPTPTIILLEWSSLQLRCWPWPPATSSRSTTSQTSPSLFKFSPTSLIVITFHIRWRTWQWTKAKTCWWPPPMLGTSWSTWSSSWEPQGLPCSKESMETNQLRRYWGQYLYKIVRSTHT